ncbi:MAG TPA: DNA alkylation repair protein [Anaerolineae bacterium]|nr:DNA alkylation repair protein [Anaerolineae bacterium]
MNAKQADALGVQVAALAQAGQADQAYALLSPILARRTPFRLLDRIGQAVGAGRLAQANVLLERIAANGTEGGWVVIGSALGQQLDRDLGGTLARCRAFTIVGSVWYATDILGERVPGPALLSSFEPTLVQLSPWREDADRWVRRSVGVAVHFWAKRSQGMAKLAVQAEALLEFLGSMFGEWDMDAAKGVGWGLKTLGKYYPDLVSGWLEEQVFQQNRRHRALMLRKALTYLPEEKRARLTGVPDRG